MNSIKGWQKVFKFTFMQMVKSKAFIISTVIIVAVVMLMSIGLNFLPKMLADSGILGGDDHAEIETNTTIYLSDNSGLAIDLGMGEHRISPSEAASKAAEVNQSAQAEVLIEIVKSDYGYDILASRPLSDEFITADECNMLLGMVYNQVWTAHMLSIGVPEESLGEASPHITTQITIAGETPKNELAVVISGVLPMVSALVLFMFIFLYSQFTAQSIATEKTSRVMETLLTSVRPMAVILGKVLGMGLASLTQFVTLFAATFGISAIVAPFGTIGEVFGSVEISDPDMQMVKNAFDETFASFNIMSILWILIIFILGFLFYSLIAGLFGATVNRMEDLQASLQPLALIGVLGFYLAYIAPAFSMGSGERNIMEIISYYFPISSPFALPGVIISGEMNPLHTLISVLILAVFNVLMLMFVARVYEAIIMHTGNRVKIGTIFKMARKK